MIIGNLHSIKIKAGSKEEAKFTELLKTVGVDRSRVMCKPGYLFWTEYDEYIISDGLWKQIEHGLGDILKRRNR